MPVGLAGVSVTYNGSPTPPTSPGSYALLATLTNDTHEAPSVSGTLTILRPPLVVAGGPYAGSEGVPLNLAQATASSTDGGALTYEWDFGDGSPRSTSLRASHTYVQDGLYSARLVVRDGAGSVGTASTSVSIANAPPAVAKLWLSIPQLNAPSVGESWDFAFSIVDKGVYDAPWMYTVNWGDGTPVSSGSRASLGGSISASHVYAAPGSFSVTIIVRDKDGAAGIRTIPVIVKPATAP
jgi:PKD repeat protein